MRESIPAGPFFDTLHIATDRTDIPVIKIPISGEIAAGMQFERRDVFLGIIRSSQAVKKSLNITVSDPRFKVEGVTTGMAGQLARLYQNRLTSELGVVAASFAQVDEDGVADYALLLPVLLGVLAGAACGTVNGLVVTRGRVAPFIVTLGMMTAARGLAKIISDGRPVSGLSEAFTDIAEGGVWGVPTPIIIFAAVAVCSMLFLERTRLGRYVYATGGNENAARASGINVHAIKTMVYVICGACAGLAGVLQAARIHTGQPNAGLMYELDAIAAVVIGGASLSGGVGGVRGTILGVILIGLIGSGLDMYNVSSYYQEIVKGAIIVGAVWLDVRGRK